MVLQKLAFHHKAQNREAWPIVMDHFEESKRIKIACSSTNAFIVRNVIQIVRDTADQFYKMGPKTTDGADLISWYRKAKDSGASHYFKVTRLVFYLPNLQDRGQICDIAIPDTFSPPDL